MPKSSSPSSFLGRCQARCEITAVLDTSPFKVISTEGSIQANYEIPRPTERQCENWGTWRGGSFLPVPAWHSSDTTRGTALDLELCIKSNALNCAMALSPAFFPPVCKGNNCIHQQGQWFGETWKIAATRNPLE